jgi:hypothetical protein
VLLGLQYRDQKGGQSGIEPVLIFAYQGAEAQVVLLAPGRHDLQVEAVELGAEIPKLPVVANHDRRESTRTAAAGYLPCTETEKTTRQQAFLVCSGAGKACSHWVAGASFWVGPAVSCQYATGHLPVHCLARFSWKLESELFALLGAKIHVGVDLVGPAPLQGHAAFHGKAGVFCLGDQTQGELGDGVAGRVLDHYVKLGVPPQEMGQVGSWSHG